jgi:hypothetical protein
MSVGVDRDLASRSECPFCPGLGPRVFSASSLLGCPFCPGLGTAQNSLGLLLVVAFRSQLGGALRPAPRLA